MPNTRLSLDGYGARRAGSFSGKAATVVSSVVPGGSGPSSSRRRRVLSQAQETAEARRERRRQEEIETRIWAREIIEPNTAMREAFVRAGVTTDDIELTIPATNRRHEEEQLLIILLQEL